MRISLAVGLVGAVVAAPGCCLLEKVTHGAICHDYVVETQECPIQDSADCLMSNRHYSEAVTTWSAFRQEHPGPYSDDFAWGFKRGFAASLEAGAHSQNLPQPPQYYCQVKYETPQGSHAVDDWYAGYEHGVMAARGTGDRAPGSMVGPGPLPEGAVRADEVGQPVVSPQTMPAFQEAPVTIIEEPNPKEHKEHKEKAERKWQAIEGQGQPDMNPTVPSALGRRPEPIMGMILFEEKAKERWPTPPKDLKEDSPSWQPAGDEEITHLKPAVPVPSALTKEPSTAVWHASKSVAADTTPPAPPP